MKKMAKKSRRYSKAKSAAKARMVKLLAFIPIVIIMGMFFFKISANGQDDIRETKAAYYHELEGRYMEVLRFELGNRGLGSAGVTMTSVIDINGDRSYKVQLHHEKISRMDDDERQAFLLDMAKVDFANPESPVIYEILD